MTAADLYLEKVDFLRYLPKTDCGQCGLFSCEDFVENLKKGIRKPEDCTGLSPKKVFTLKIVLGLKASWLEVPLLTHPRPSQEGLVEVNNPTSNSTVIISGNNEHTEGVIMNILGTTKAPFFVIFVNTEGNTVDMSMIYKTFTPERVSKALRDSGVESRVSNKEILIPGFAYPLRKKIENLTGWRVRVGPLCAAELPLFLSDIWS